MSGSVRFVCLPFHRHVGESCSTLLGAAFLVRGCVYVLRKAYRCVGVLVSELKYKNVPFWKVRSKSWLFLPKVGTNQPAACVPVLNPVLHLPFSQQLAVHLPTYYVLWCRPPACCKHVHRPVLSGLISHVLYDLRSCGGCCDACRPPALLCKHVHHPVLTRLVWSSLCFFLIYLSQIEALSLDSLKASADEYREHFSRALGRAIQGTIKVCNIICQQRGVGHDCCGTRAV